MAPRKSKSRTRTAQQRRRAAIARQDAERDELRRLEAEAEEQQASPWYRRLLTRVPREPREPGAPAPRPVAAAVTTAWSRRGLLTLSLLVGVLQLPFGILGYAADPHRYPLAAYLVLPLNPGQVIPIPLVLGVLIGSPLARKLADQERSLRFLECLGYAAVIDILLIFGWSLAAQSSGSNASASDGLTVAKLAVADVLALAGGAYLYPVISRFLSPQRRMRR